MKAFKILCAGALAAGLLTGGATITLAKDGHWVDSGQAVWKDGSGKCWKSGYWTPAMAIQECDPDLMKKPMSAPRAAPAAKPAPKAKTLTITSTQLFAFNKSALTDESRGRLDREVISRLGEFSSIQFINVYGHTDRIGSAQYNQKLSERRAEAVKAYLVSKGVKAGQIETYGYGKTQPAKYGCDEKMKRSALIDCLAPNRRVVVEAKGMPK